jgi:hypothetical protein
VNSLHTISSSFQKQASIDIDDKLQTDADMNTDTNTNTNTNTDAKANNQVASHAQKKNITIPPPPSFHDCHVLKSLWRDIIVTSQTNKNRNHPKEQQQQQQQRRTLANFIPRQGPVAPENVILATHISSERFSKLLTQTKWWRGPISVAVYINSYASIDRFSQFLDQHADQLCNTSFHVLLEGGTYTDTDTDTTYTNTDTDTNTYTNTNTDTNANDNTDITTEAFYYPHNILRNIALMNVESDYFFATDADHVPSPNSYARLSKLLLPLPHSNNNNNTNDIKNTNTNMDIMRSRLRQKTLFVFPAFELFANKKEQFATEDMLPQTKDQLLSKVETGRMAPFQKKRCPNCHGPTDFDRWYQHHHHHQHHKNNNTTEEAFYYTLSNRNITPNFEPYVLGYRHGIPRYWESFRGYGYDKISWFVQLTAAGYKYAVLRDFWVAHLRHPISPKAIKQGKARNAPYWMAFQRHMQDFNNTTNQ